MSAAVPDVSDGRMSMRVYSVNRAGTVSKIKALVSTDGCLDAEVAANPISYPLCECKRCRRSRHANVS
ncbi:hypothetical protein GCM10009753_06680 [Streptantibioticus ferralitis]